MAVTFWKTLVVFDVFLSTEQGPNSLCCAQNRDEPPNRDRAQNRDRHRLLEQTVPVPSITVLRAGQGIGTSKRALPTPHPTFLRITHTPGQHVKFRNCHAHREPMKQAVACAAWHTLRRDVSRCLWISQTSKRLRRSTTLHPRARPQVRFPNAEQNKES